MKRKTHWSKRFFIFLMLPLFTIILTALAYGSLQNYVTLSINLTTAQKPNIKLTCTLANAYNNSVTLFVNSTTRIIKTTEPAFPLIYINVTNTGETPIDKIKLNYTIHEDWTLRQVRMQLVQTDGTRFEINETYFTVEYNQGNSVTITTSNINNALGKTLNQNESIMISIYIEYNLIEQQIPNEYETSPPIYINNITATAWIGNWQAKPATSTLVITTSISET